MRKPPTEELCRGLDRPGGVTVVSEVQDKETGEILSGSPQTIKSVLVSRLKPGASSGVQWCAIHRPLCGLKVLRTLKNQTGVMRWLAPSSMALPIPCHGV